MSAPADTNQDGISFRLPGVRRYGEFGARNRPDGWNVWRAFAISPSIAAAKLIIGK
jgi:hypothetical protein